MARNNKKIKIRIPEPDQVYGNRQLTKLINQVMKDGKKTIAQTQVYRGLEIAAKSAKKTPVQVFEEAVAQITPKMEVRSRRIGGAAYQVPTPVRGPRGFSLALRWLVDEARKRPNKEYKTFGEKLAAEMTAAIGGTGGAVEKKITMHRQAEANKAFAHFRW
ncbi:30S ribosomal protein S7 [Candidatus Collierbacteria bacterium]|nr:30S ribosomal protein S7 [Candidatus Collierbacteria bacterium]